MPGLVPPARPKPLRRGEGPGIHILASARRTWMAGTSPAMTEFGDTSSPPLIRPLLLLLPDLRLPRRILAAGRCGAGLDLVFLRLLGLAVAALLSLGHDVVSSWVSSSSACEIGAAMVAWAGR